MFCDRCGAAVPVNQGFCGKCGKELRGPMPVYLVPSRVQQHLRLLGILWLALSALTAIGGFAVFVVANTVFARYRFSEPHMTPGPPFMHSLMLGISAFIFIKAAAGFITGWGLLNREPWARMLTIVLSFFALFNVPFGTALGIYGLWILLPANAEREYQQVSKQAA